MKKKVSFPFYRKIKNKLFIFFLLMTTECREEIKLLNSFIIKICNFIYILKRKIEINFSNNIN